VKDVLGLLEPEPGGAYCLSPHARIAGLRRPILFAPPSMRALDLLLKMQATHTHLALVIDEYGGTDGLVSIEDITRKLWAISPTSMTRTRPPSRPTAMVTSPMPAWTWTISGPRPAMICWLRRAKTNIGRDIDSLGGLVVSLLGRVPLRGEIVAHPDGTEFQVLEADPAPCPQVASHFAQIPRNGVNVLTQTGAGFRNWPAGADCCSHLQRAGFSATGFAPLEFFPFLLLGYGALVLLLDGAHAGPRPVRRAAWLGWSFYFGQFLVGWHWIAYAFLILSGRH